MPHTVLGRLPRNAIEAWFWTPITVLRISLVATYGAYIYGAWIAFWAGIPIFSLLTPPGYTSVWAVLLGAAAVTSTISSLKMKWERIERFSALVLSMLMSAYCLGLNIQGYAEGDLDRQFIGVIAVIAIILPFGRFLYLAAQSGKKKSENVPPLPAPDNAVR